MTDDWTPRPIEPVERVRPIGPAINKPAGIQPVYAKVPVEPTQPLDEVQASLASDRTERAKRAWETRRAKHHLPDRHFTGQHPYDVALEALHEQMAKIAQVIRTLEELKHGRL